MKKLTYLIFLLFIGLCLLTIACSPSIVTTPQIIQKPEGSVLEKHSEWTNEYVMVGPVRYNKLIIYATVQNIGDEGSFYVNAHIDSRTSDI